MLILVISEGDLIMNEIRFAIVIVVLMKDGGDCGDC